MTTFLLPLSKADFLHPTGHADSDMAEVTIEIVFVYEASSLYLLGSEYHFYSPLDEGSCIRLDFGSRIKRYKRRYADCSTVVIAQRNEIYWLSDAFLRLVKASVLPWFCLLQSSQPASNSNLCTGGFQSRLKSSPYANSSVILALILSITF